MKYLLFQNPNRDYGATFDTVLVGARKRGFGAYDEKDAKLLMKLAPEHHISELTVDQYEGLKKKAKQATSFVETNRNGGTGSLKKSACSVCRKGGYGGPV